MKTTSAALLLITLVISAIFPAFGQKIRQPRSDAKFEIQQVNQPDFEPTFRPRPGLRRTFAQFETVDAITDGGGAYVRWQMASETGNLGFLVYRVGRRGEQQANENLVTGSMSKLGSEVMYGGKYEFFDPSGTIGTTYMIQAICPDGSRLSSPVASSRYTANFDAEAGISKAELIRVSTGQNGELQNTLPTDLIGTERAKSNLSSVTDAVNLNVHRAVVNTPGIKIGVKKDGFYRVRLNTDINPVSNIFTSANTANWRLYRDGIEQSVIIGTDGSGVYMDFYGKAIETQESDTAVYYLIVDTNNVGKRIPSQRIKRVDPIGVSASYVANTLKRERVTYDNSILNGDAENFWGNAVLNSAKNIVVALSGVDFTQPTFTVNLDMQGYSATVTPSVRVVLNGTEIGIANALFPREHYSAQFTVPTSLLFEGNNTFQLTSLNGGGDISYFDSIRLQYNRAYLAESNRLLFTGAPAKSTTLSGFSTANIRIFNIGTDGSTTQLIGFTTQQVGPSSFSAQYPPTRQRLQPIFAVEDSGLLQASAITVNNPSNLSSTVRNADLVIISYSQADFMNASNTWADYRRSVAGGSFNVEVVDVADIYDEYSYGVLSGEAVRNFLQHVHQNWTSQVTGKKYVLLMGDASYDPKNFKGYGNFNYVPTKIINTIYNEVPADDLMADFNGDGLADMAIGRLPVRFASEITTIFNKTTAFETPAMQSMDRGVLFAYDVPNGYQFGVMSEDLANQLPVAVPKVYVPRGLPPPDEMTANPQALSNLVNAINVPGGKYIVNYSGHGAQSLWDQNFLSNASVPQLTNANGPAIFTMLTCLNGFFIQPRPVIEDSIAEKLVLSPVGGGPVAWASSGKTTADVQMLMGRQFFQQIGIGNIKRMGDLVIDAKAQTPANSDVMTTWILFGDPMLKVRE
ncbi:MAG TPA: C25 family cysteine peptidase [Pyrinomonadaceae bacterium]|nr:C25 family cysteine peptidase [Pyrinomonadaceae bacterium]